MSLRKQSHGNLSEVDSELKNLDETKEEIVTFATRDPNSGDKGRFWLNQNGSIGSRLWFRHNITGTWTVV